MEFKAEPRITEPNYNEVLLYLGYRGQDIDDALEAQIRRCIAEVVNAARPRLVFRQMPVTAGADGGTIEGFRTEGRDLPKLLATCHEAVLMAATVGPEVDQLLNRTKVTNMGDALIMDACASAAIENVCNNFEADLRVQAEANGLYLTDRFSPGYGDLPLYTQAAMIEALNTSRRIGLTLSPSLMMIPTKSVTAVMGLSDVPQTLRAHGCENCNMFKTCSFRKRGEKCSE